MTPPADGSATAAELRHDLANVALALDAIAEALDSGVADRATAVRLIKASAQRMNEVGDRYSPSVHDEAR